MNIVIVGHVDHGKSTIIGRLLTDTYSLPVGKLERVKETCRQNAKPFEYAFLLDALKEEQAQGITIDSARCFFKTAKRDYMIIDAPGHVEFLKNMVTGASRGEAALLVIDAREGIQENTRRHGYLLTMIGIRQIAVLVNKMDLVHYNQEVFQELVASYAAFLNEIGIDAAEYIPVSGVAGDNIVNLSRNMPWYHGRTILEELDHFSSAKLPEEQPFRMPVQGVYKFTRNGDDRRIVAGTIESGRLNIGDEVIFYPSGKRSKVRSLEGFNQISTGSFSAGQAIGFTLTEQIYIKRGDIAGIADQLQPKVTSRIRVKLFWLGKKPLEVEKEYILKLGTAKVKMQIEAIVSVLDASTLQFEFKNIVARHEVAECIFKLEQVIAFDLTHENAATGRFVIIDDYEISGGGMIVEGLEDKDSSLRQQVILRNYKWEKSIIPPEERAKKYNHQAALVLITGARNVGKKTLAKALEQQLFNEGKVVYFLGIGNVIYGVDADIKKISNNQREEHVRRLAEVSQLMLDAGMIVIITAIELTQKELEIFKTVVDIGRIETIWVGEKITTDIAYDLHIPRVENQAATITLIKQQLQKEEIFLNGG
jgi:bifunctional enzyme CysN/CysC